MKRLAALLPLMKLQLWSNPVGLVAALVIFAFIAGGSTTAASATSFRYDAPADARVELHEFGAADASPTQLSDLREESASLLVKASGASTTLSTRSVATEAVAATGDDLLKPGPWAAGSVPSSAPGKITQAERNALNPIGDEFGCHSCGATTPGTRSGNWVGDHQPVSSQVRPGTPQVLYPQCLACSNAQGLYIINMMRGGPR